MTLRGASGLLGGVRGEGVSRTYRTGRFALDLADAQFIPLVPLFGGPGERPNDGHIPVESAKLGHFRGCVPPDHLDLIRRPASQHASTQPWTGFDHLAFYRTLAHELALRGM